MCNDVLIIIIEDTSLVKLGKMRENFSEIYEHNMLVGFSYSN